MSVGAAATASERLRAGDPAGALAALQVEVRARPQDAKLRVFLFQLLAVLGQWDRARNQLDVAGELDAGALAMVHTYRDAIRAEVLRARVFAGKTVPMVFGQPEQWLAFLIESLLTESRGDAAAAAKLRERALDEAPAVAGMIDGKPFEWIADADSRLGPVIEAVINGNYYWLPFTNIARLDLEAPTDLRDVVWTAGHVQFTNGGEVVALVPTRYPGSHGASDGHVALARRTEWTEVSPGVYHGLGQRLLATDSGEFALMDVRNITFGSTAADPT